MSREGDRSAAPDPQFERVSVPNVAPGHERPEHDPSRDLPRQLLVSTQVINERRQRRNRVLIRRSPVHSRSLHPSSLTGRWAIGDECTRAYPGDVGVEQRAAVLRGTSLFGGLDDEPLRAIAEPSRARSYKKGEIVFHQGDLGETLFAVSEGLIKVFVTSEDGDEVVLATLRPGDTFGELALVDGGPRSASASVIEAATLVLLTRSAFFAALEHHPQIREALFKSLGRLLRRVLVYASDLVFLDLSGRVAKLLVGLSDERGEKHHEGGAPRSTHEPE